MTKIRTPLAPAILSLLIGSAQALAAILALLPVLVPDADVTRFLFHAFVPSIILQIIGLGISALLGLGRCPWVLSWRVIVLLLSIGGFWSYGWGPGTSVWLGSALGFSFVISAFRGVISEFVLGLTFAVACFGIGHPLLLVDLVPFALLSTWVLAIIRLLLWWRLGVHGHPKDIAVVSLVTGLFAPTVMLLGGYLGHDTALLSSAFFTQIIGFVAARWVARAVTHSPTTTGHCNDARS